MANQSLNKSSLLRETYCVYTCFVKLASEPSHSPVNHAHVVRQISIIIVGIILVSFASWFYINQHRDIESLNKRVSQLAFVKSSVDKQNSTLNTENKNLNKAVKLLQGQLNKDSANSSTEQSATSPTVSSTSSMGIISATNTTIPTYPPAAGQSWPANIDAIAVNITIHNNTTSNQYYGTNQFGAVTDAGVVVGTFPWTPNISQPAWTSTAIVPGASLNETIYFSVGQNLSMLTWQPPGQAMVELPFPTVD